MTTVIFSREELLQCEDRRIGEADLAKILQGILNGEQPNMLELIARWNPQMVRETDSLGEHIRLILTPPGTNYPFVLTVEHAARTDTYEESTEQARD